MERVICLVAYASYLTAVSTSLSMSIICPSCKDPKDLFRKIFNWYLTSLNVSHGLAVLQVALSNCFLTLNALARSHIAKVADFTSLGGPSCTGLKEEKLLISNDESSLYTVND